MHLSKTTFLGGVQLVVEQVRKEGAMTLAPHCAAQHYHDAYGLVRLDMDEEPDLGVGKHRLQELRNAQARRPRAGAEQRGLCRRTCEKGRERVDCKAERDGMIVKFLFFE